MEMRTEHKDAFQEKHGVKLGFMSGFVKVIIDCRLVLSPLNT